MNLKDYSFLPFFLDEPIYRVNDPVPEADVPEPDNVAIQVEEATQPMEKEPAIPFIGDNRKNLLIISESEGSEIIHESEKELLGKILTAIGYNFMDVALVDRNSAEAERLLQYFSPEQVLVFATWPVYAGQHYQLFTEISDVLIIESEPLSQLEADRNKKGKLWRLLKEVFIAG